MARARGNGNGQKIWQFTRGADTLTMPSIEAQGRKPGLPCTRSFAD